MPNDAEPTQQAAGQLSQVRDLLFGEQSRATELRLDSIQAELERTRELLRGELGGLRAGLTEELSELRQALGLERDERGTGERRVQAALDDARSALDSSISEAEERAQQELDSLSGKLERERRELTSELEVLASKKLDRANLAALLSELARRVTDEDEG